jgi:hypothetical protein
MSNGEKVSYNGKEYIALHFYSSGFCEIKEINGFKIELVHISELKLIK